MAEPLLAYDDALAPMSTGQRVVAAALCLPWLACATGWAYVSVTMLAVQDAGRWLRG